MTGGVPLEIDPSAAARIVAAASGLLTAIDNSMGKISRLTNVAASGSFRSAGEVDQHLSSLGAVCGEAFSRMRTSVDDAKEAARQAGLRLVNQDEENQRNIKRALESPDGRDPVTAALNSGLGSQSPSTTPQIANQPTSPVKPAGEPAAGTFAMGVAPESPANFIIDVASAALGAALPDSLHTLAMQWLQLANSLNAALFTFDQQYSSVLGTPAFSGEAADKMKGALSSFSASGKRVATHSLGSGPRVDDATMASTLNRVVNATSNLHDKRVSVGRE